MTLEELHIETERLIIRPYREADGLSLKNGIDESLVSLKEFMPWARYEPEAVIHKERRIERWNQDILNDKDFTLGIFSKTNQAFIGSTGLHRRSENGIYEIGYWVHQEFQGKGYITEAAEALTNFAFEHLDAEKLEIRCGEKNIKSAQIPQRLNYTLEYTFRTLEKNQEGKRLKHQVWCLFKEEWKNDYTHS
jgi:RimJ/RimL family protein N-acetyltransferase